MKEVRDKMRKNEWEYKNMSVGHRLMQIFVVLELRFVSKSQMVETEITISQNHNKH